MEISGKVWKDKKLWLIEAPLLNAMTQGRTQKEAVEMMKDLIHEMLISYFTDVDHSFAVDVNVHKNGVIGITTTNNSLMYALSLKRQREISKSTVREASERLGSAYPNAYAQYERGKTRISLEKYDQLLSAANPSRHAIIGLAF